MKPYLLIFCIFFIFLNCEDKKNTPEKSENTTQEKSETKPDTIIKTKKENFKDTLDTIVNLSNASVEEFLNEYGKNNPERFITLETNYGKIELELYKNTPLHRAHFIYLIKSGYLNTTVFHRVVSNFIIQGGNSDRTITAKMRGRMGTYTLPPEIFQRHNRGALAAAKEYRDNPDDRSSSFEFYIVQSHKGAHHLDPNYTVFGRVISGMNIVDQIAALETDEGDWPLYNVNINAVINE